MSARIEVSRRSVLIAGAAAGGALVVPILVRSTSSAKAFEPNAFIRVDAGGVTLQLPKTEMGQGIHTAIAMLVAEELEIAPETLRVELPPGDASRFAPIPQETGGSTSIREVWLPLRQAAATTRAALVGAAAARWEVSESDCIARIGTVVHNDSGRTLDYRALAPLAGTRPLPEKVALKPNGAFEVIGKPRRRLDGDAKARGATQFGIDVRVPDMLVATLAQAPAIGGELIAIDERAALGVPGVKRIVKGRDVVFVVADHYWAAKQGIEAAAPQWTPGTRAKLDQKTIDAQLAEGSAEAGHEAAKEGDVEAQMKAATRIVRAEYAQPFLAHAPMEPANCVIHVTPDSCEIWTGTQVPAAARDVAAKGLSLDVEKVTVHNQFMGGGFGRRLETDMIERAVELGRSVRVPVKLIWSREEDIQHGLYRPAYHDRIEAGLAADGRLIAWHHRIAGSSIFARLTPNQFNGVDADAVDGAIATPYALPARRISFQRVESGVPTSWWRGVGGLRSAFAVECFMDELAHAAGQDPVAFRRSLITDPRARRVLDLVAEKAGWDQARGERVGLGVAIIHLWGTYMAAIAEVAAAEGQTPHVRRVTVAVDCGQQINPLGIRAQVESGIVFGLSAALFGRISIAEGKVEQSNYSDYRVLRINETPRIDTFLVNSAEAPGGMGEPPCAVIAPAVANALFAATGDRSRSVPLASEAA